jgi:hypothetical protein
MLVSLWFTAALAGPTAAPRLADGLGWGGVAPRFEAPPILVLPPRIAVGSGSLHAPTPLPAPRASPQQVVVGWAALVVIAAALEPSTLGTPRWAQDRGLSLSDRPPYEP